MTEVPPFLFMLTSTALVLGAAITVRGLLGFRPVANAAALSTPVTEGEPADVLATQAAAPDSASSGDGVTSNASPEPSAATGVRDLKEPMVMTLAGVFITIFALLAISALVHS